MFFSQTGGDCCPDWLIECQNFKCGDALYDAIVTSLFSEARNPTCKTGGWWCDPSYGSRLHTIDTTDTSEALAQAEDYVRAALAWLENDGVISGLDVTSEYLGGGHVSINVAFSEPEVCEFIFTAREGDFAWVWDGFNTRT